MGVLRCVADYAALIRLRGRGRLKVGVFVGDRGHGGGGGGGGGGRRSPCFPARQCHSGEGEIVCRCGAACYQVPGPDGPWQAAACCAVY